MISNTETTFKSLLKFNEENGLSSEQSETKLELIQLKRKTRMKASLASFVNKTL